MVGVGAEGLVGIGLLIYRSTKVVQFCALTSAVKGCGRKMVETVIGDNAFAAWLRRALN